MAVAIVDAFEVIQIEHGETQRTIFAAGAKGAVFKQLQDMGVVVQPGQAVTYHPRLEVASTDGAVAHGGNQMARLDRFGQKVITALAHGIELFVHVVFGRQINDRHTDVAVVVADHLGQLSASTGGHIHIEDDQVRLELRQFGHGLNRINQCAGDNPGAVEQALGVQCLSP